MKKRAGKLLSSVMLVAYIVASLTFFDLSPPWADKTSQAAAGFYRLIEAEDANMSGDVRVATSRSGYSGTGYATGFTQSSNNSWTVQVDIPVSRHYTFIIRNAADSYKENYLLVDGTQVGKIVSPGDGAWHEAVIETVYLEAGTVTISIGEFWGWFDLDYIIIEDGSAVPDSVYTGATANLANPNANQKTRNIMAYLKSIYGKHTLAGQSCTLNANTEIESLYAFTGKYPAVRLLDFIFLSPASDWYSREEVNLALEWSQMGGLVSIQWHWHAPKGGASFYTERTSFDLSKAVTSLDISRKPLDEIKAMYEAGTISEECYLLVRDIDVISGYLKELEAAGVTVLWRPLHEASGGWFWWGAKGKEPYLWLYRLMFDRQTYYHQLNNLIWVWNGQSADWYVGDEYCDIAGLDIYAEKHSYSVLPDEFMKCVNYTNGNKMVALTENGVMMDPDLAVRDNTYWLWFGVWYGDFIIDWSGNISDTYTERSMVYKVYNSDVVITLDELPNFNSPDTPTPTPEPTPTPDPGPTPTPEPTPSPTPTPTPVPGEFNLTLSNSGNSSPVANTITNNIRISHNGGGAVDLSKLSIRYYYTKEGLSSESFYCDNAALQMNRAPWYVALTSSVKGSITRLAQPKTNADSYLEITFDTGEQFAEGATLIIDTRMHKNDWTTYDQSNDHSYIDSSNITVYYDGRLILGNEPQ
jgi:Cellulose binding domain./Carbohydrate binding module (family 6)./Glycosyl hydrolase family 26.